MFKAWAPNLDEEQTGLSFRPQHWYRPGPEHQQSVHYLYDGSSVTWGYYDPVYRYNPSDGLAWQAELVDKCRQELEKASRTGLRIDSSTLRSDHRTVRYGNTVPDHFAGPNIKNWIDHNVLEIRRWVAEWSASLHESILEKKEKKQRRYCENEMDYDSSIAISLTDEEILEAITIKEESVDTPKIRNKRASDSSLGGWSHENFTIQKAAESSHDAMSKLNPTNEAIRPLALHRAENRLRSSSEISGSSALLQESLPESVFATPKFSQPYLRTPSGSGISMNLSPSDIQWARQATGEELPLNDGTDVVEDFGPVGSPAKARKISTNTRESLAGSGRVQRATSEGDAAARERLGTQTISSVVKRLSEGHPDKCVKRGALSLRGSRRMPSMGAAGSLEKISEERSQP